MAKQKEIIQAIVGETVSQIQIPTAQITKEAIEEVLVGEIDSHSHAGGGGGLTQAQILTRQL